MRPFRALTGVLVVGALVAVLVGTAPPGVAGATAGPVGGRSPAETAVDWRPCPEDPSAECGTLRLPVDWARPSGERFALALARRTATDPGRRVGVLLVNPGGPGDPGARFAIERAPSYFSARVRERFDIVGFDPRGVGGSRPVRCSTGLLAQRPSPYPRDQAEFERLAAFNRALREDCRRHSGPLYDHADTLSVVRDMEAVRVALGEERISYFGHSYGTLIGQQYAERYGERIRAMALTANMDHSLGIREFLVSSAATAEDSFHQFVNWCERTTSCALHGRDVTDVWDRLLARADQGAVRDPGRPGRVLTANAITHIALTRFYGPRWDVLADYVADLDAQRPTGPDGPRRPPPRIPPRAADPTAVGAVAVDPVAPEPTTAEPTTADPFHAVFCQDWRFRPKDHREFARLTAAETRAAPHMRGAPRAHAAIAGCVGWPDEVNNPQQRPRITKAPTILLLHGRHDPASPYIWAVTVHRQTRGTTALLPYDGAGHAVYGRTDCTRDAVDGYLMELKVPQAGSRCAPATAQGH
ncbi:alpha/beta fold hydrolase [Streptomyces sp. NPDC057638]|uniref:alpha/beta fold hydrolase n=1 Tax=Streptomyces sp. NPDC057638 TaxID=3346190 RepID=UPI00368C395E